jgi:hypothetical protein
MKIRKYEGESVAISHQKSHGITIVQRVEKVMQGRKRPSSLSAVFVRWQTFGQQFEVQTDKLIRQ